MSSESSALVRTRTARELGLLSCALGSHVNAQDVRDAAQWSRSQLGEGLRCAARNPRRVEASMNATTAPVCRRAKKNIFEGGRGSSE
eukprot:3349280-Pleurochrysis_carterae.AAC.3